MRIVISRRCFAAVGIVALSLFVQQVSAQSAPDTIYTPSGDKTYVGYPHESREELTARVKRINRAGYQIAIHANGRRNRRCDFCL